MKRLLLALGLFFLPLLYPATDPTSSAVEVTVGRGHGSGVYIVNGYVLTAAHVVFDEKGPIRVSVEDEPIGYEVEVVSLDLDHDFALLHIKTPVAGISLPASAYVCSNIQVGQEIMVAGWPLDLGKITSKGYVAGGDVERGPWSHSFIAILPVTFGNSGGPVYDWRGRVIGIVVGIVGGTSLSIIIPLSAVCSQIPV